jgi:hypothetical protein
LEPRLSSELGEPILRCIALHGAGTSDRMEMDSLTPWWRPKLFVDGQPHTRLPRTMFLILTPTRVLITDTTRGMTGYRPVLGSPILTLLRGEAEATAVQDDDGLWLYHLKSRAQSAELELELASSGRGIAAELAGQLREFSATPRPANATSGLTAPPEPFAASTMLDNRRRWATKSNRTIGAVAATLSLLLFGFGAYPVYGYHVGTPTKATVVSCSTNAGGSVGVAVVNALTSCRGEWTVDEKTYTGNIWGNVDFTHGGSLLDIRVHNGRAFAPGFPKLIFVLGAVCAVIAILLFMAEKRTRPGAGPARRGRHAGP